MKFCPFCQKDFDDNQTKCPECGETLLNGTSLENEVIFDHQNEELVLKLFNYLCENDFQSIQYFYNTRTGMHCITASSGEHMKAMQTMLLYLDEEDTGSDLTQHEREAAAGHISEMLEGIIPDEGAKTFVNAKERYDDMISSASSLIVVGLAGFILIALIYFNIIKLQMNMLFYILSIVMFSAFIITGILSCRKALKIKSTISEEESQAEKIKNFLLKEYDPSPLEETYSLNDTDITEEEKYFARTEYMKKMIMQHFENPDELLADGMIEEVYNDIYSESDTENT